LLSTDALSSADPTLGPFTQPFSSIGALIVIEVERTCDLAASPSEVWAVLFDFGALSSWADNVDHSCLMSDQTEGVGMVRRIQSGPMTLLERVLTWEPNVGLSYALEGLPLVVRSATNTWTIVEKANGSQVTITSRVNAGPRPPQQLVAKVVGHKLGQASNQMLAGLKAKLQ
jgi:Polyketide cyclase / dehydrase and lipid transport